VTLLYFAWVRQKIGRGEEQMTLPAGVTTIAHLVSALRMRGAGYAEAFSDPRRLRAARNQEHVQLDSAISDTDEIAFFPPVTGG
jgi:molybdopterin synthase sulfur carrier subunit